MDFLFGSTPEDKAVEAATNELLLDSDWEKNLNICDEINRDKEGGKEWAKAIRKRIDHRNPKVVLLALTLLEMCVKNCSSRFHDQVANDKMVKEVGNVALKSKNREARDKAATLIMSWAEGFSRVNKYPVFQQTYNDLRSKGVEFPARDITNMAPIFTPAKSVTNTTDRRPDRPTTGTSPPPSSSSSLSSSSSRSPSTSSKYPPQFSKYTSTTPEYVDKTKRELGAVVHNLRVLGDMLVSAPTPASVRANEAITQLFGLVGEVRHRIVNLIAEIENEELLDLLLTMNENVRGFHDYYNAKVLGRTMRPPALVVPTALVPYTDPNGPAAQPSLETPPIPTSVSPLPTPQPTSNSTTPAATKPSSHAHSVSLNENHERKEPEKAVSRSEHHEDSENMFSNPPPSHAPLDLSVFQQTPPIGQARPTSSSPGGPDIVHTVTPPVTNNTTIPANSQNNAGTADPFAALASRGSASPPSSQPHNQPGEADHDPFAALAARSSEPASEDPFAALARRQQVEFSIGEGAVEVGKQPPADTSSDNSLLDYLSGNGPAPISNQSQPSSSSENRSSLDDLFNLKQT